MSVLTVEQLELQVIHGSTQSIGYFRSVTSVASGYYSTVLLSPSLLQ